MLFLRTLMMFVFVFSLVGFNGSYAREIKRIQDFQDCKNYIHELDHVNPLQNVTNYHNYLWGNNGFKQNED